MAYDEALQSGDPTQLSDSVLRPIQPVATDSYIILSPSDQRGGAKVNGTARSHHNNVRLLLIKYLLLFIL